MRTLENFYRLEKCDFILESKMTELNRNKNSKQPYQTDAVWKLYVILEINDKINKTFYTCFTDLLFLMYEKIFKKAVKLGSFIQCSVHMFLRLIRDFWKISLRILWNHILKDFKVKQGQCDSIFPKTFSF